MKKLYLLLVGVFLIGIQAHAQRFLEEVFTDVEITRNEVYGVNATVILVPDTMVGEAVPQPLVMDIYEPAGDTETERPLVIYFHTGNFIPWPQNQSASGTKTDSTVVEICTRLAKMGYVVASATYRQGWNPVAPMQDTRVFTLINAAYRGVQDANTCIRYFKRSFAEAANPYGVDTSRITLFGQGTGGYISLNTSILDAYAKIPTASDGKFLIDIPGIGILPMIEPSINGNVEGTTVGMVPTNPPQIAAALGLPPGDTLNYPNHVGYSSDFHLTVNLGGAMGDSSWVDPGQVPGITFQVPTDPFAPYKEGNVIVPVVNLDVVEVQGGYIYQALQNQYGNNQVFVDANIMDNYTTVANSRNDGYEGLSPLFGTDGPNDSSPWDYWDKDTNPNSAGGLATNPSMSREKAHAYIDSIIGYFAPRAYVALDLMAVSTNDIESEVELLVYPNPASEHVLVATDEAHPVRELILVDASGRIMQRVQDMNHNYYMVHRQNLPSGTYFLHLAFEDGVVTKQVQFK